MRKNLATLHQGQPEKVKKNGKFNFWVSGQPCSNEKCNEDVKRNVVEKFPEEQRADLLCSRCQCEATGKPTPRQRKLRNRKLKAEEETKMMRAGK